MGTQAVALARDLPSSRVMRARVDGVDLVVWRSASGRLAAWDNRCPHRGMRLSHGFVRGESLACLYHGWHYGAEGRCAFIPAHPELDPPATIRAVRHDAQEAGGVIWVALDGNAEPAPLPEGLAPLRSLAIAAPVPAARAAFCAAPFADGTAPGCDAPEAEALLLETPDGPVAVLFGEDPEGQALAHVLAADGLSPARRVALSRWCEAVRRRAERGPEGMA
jgi:nitrite reductase/ring-hydroxylating ferredoxin subunit